MTSNALRFMPEILTPRGISLALCFGMSDERNDPHEVELAAAKAAEDRLQHGAAIPGAIDAGPTRSLEPPPAPHPAAVPATTPQIPSTDDDRADDRLEGGGGKVGR